MRWLRYKCQITIDPHKKDIETLRVKRIYYIEVKKYIFDDSYAAPDNSSKKKKKEAIGVHFVLFETKKKMM